jgi:hypothetical protein
MLMFQMSLAGSGERTTSYSAASTTACQAIWTPPATGVADTPAGAWSANSLITDGPTADRVRI